MLYEGTLAAASSRGIGANIARKIKFTQFSTQFIFQLITVSTFFH